MIKKLCWCLATLLYAVGECRTPPRATRLSTLDWVALKREQSAVLQLKFWLSLLRDRSPIEECALESLQVRVDEFAAELIRRGEPGAHATRLQS